MNDQATLRDKKMAEVCMNCPLCNRARDNQDGMANWFVRKIEDPICPFCRAYERVYGKKAHESV
ncbi:MAG: hypothetical protein U9P80_04645 [Thermodesulfobacteriota bacterium]|nr:hypothetical protein [Thermodesulfobacteriota bacterium]